MKTLKNETSENIMRLNVETCYNKNENIYNISADRSDPCLIQSPSDPGYRMIS